jgi:ribosomal protein S18 acetylase RimI-like enzyme
VWRLADAKSAPAIAAFLRAREHSCCSLSSLLLKEGRPAFPLPLGLRLAAYLRDPAGLSPVGGVLLRAAGHTLYPLFGEAPPESDAQAFALADIDLRRLGGCVGLEADVRRAEAALDVRPAAGNDYHLMRLDGGRAIPPGRPPLSGLSARRPGKADLDSLLPLQEAYEREEVLVPIHRFDRRASRASLAKALERGEVLCAELDGKVVAKAQVNARGLDWDQLGGIFVLPEWRRRGLGSWITSRLCEGLLADGRKVCLFVKKKNAAAISSYRRVGFGFSESFRISYY